MAEPGFAGAWALPAASFALAAGSPAEDQGTADVPIPTGDHTLDHVLSLAARPAGLGYDLGAFEYGATPAPPGTTNPAIGRGPEDPPFVHGARRIVGGHDVDRVGLAELVSRIGLRLVTATFRRDTWPTRARWLLPGTRARIAIGPFTPSVRIPQRTGVEGHCGAL